MEKKLLFLIILLITYLSPSISLAQCPPTVSISATTPTSICENGTVSFTSTINSNSGDNLTLQWNIGNNPINNETNPTYTSSPGVLSNGNKVSLKVTSNCSGSSVVTSSNQITIPVNAIRAPSVSLTSSTTSVCQNNSIKFTATPIFGGSGPSYKWFVDNSEIYNETNNIFEPNFTSSGVKLVRVEMISNVTCVDPTKNPASKELTVTINPTITPSLTLTPSTTNICQGESIIFNVAPTNEGTTPTYQWYVDNVPKGGNSDSFTYNSFVYLTNSNPYSTSIVKLVMTSNAACTDPGQNPVESEIDIVVNKLEEPSVSIAAFNNSNNEITDNTICAGDPIKFKIKTSTNEGANPVYSWAVNGVVKSTGNTFSTSSIQNNDRISLALTSDINCIDPTLNPAQSNDILMIVKPVLNPSVTITTDKTLICSGSSINFYATATNAGNNPTYDWKVDGVSKQSSNNSNFTSSFTNTGIPDKTYDVTVDIITTDPCSTPVFNVSNTISINVTWQKPAQPDIITGSTNICPVVNGLVYSIPEDPNATSYTWTLPPGWVATGGATTNQITVNTTNNAVRNTNILKVTANNICGTSVERILSIDVADFVEVHAGPDQTICKTVNVVNIAGTIIFGNGASQIKKLNPRWIKVSGTGTFGNPDNLTTTYTPSAADKTAGSVLLALITDKPTGNCPAGRDEIEIIFYQDATANAGDDITVCEGTPINLTGLIGGSATSLVWSSSGGSFSNTTSLNTLFTPSTTGAINVTLTTNGPCSPTATDIMIVTVDPLTTVNAGNDISICSNENATITAIFGGGATSGLWSTNGDGTFDNETALTSNYDSGTNDKSSGTVILTFTTNDPNGPCDSKVDSLILTIEPEVVVDAGEDKTICSNENVTLNGIIIGGTTSGNWSTSGNGTFNNTSLMNAIYTPSAADISTGNVTLTLTSANPGGKCAVNKDDILISINPVATVNAGTDVDICSNGTLILDDAIIGGGATEAKWEIISGGGTLSSTSFSQTPQSVIYSPIANQSGTTVLRLTTDDPDGPCEAIYDEITINISKEITITEQPLNQSVCATNRVDFSISATGDNLTYQWYKVGDIIIPGATSNVLTFNQAATSDAGSYYAEVTSSNCSSIQSEQVTLNVDEDIVITFPASDVSVCESEPGNSLTFTVVAHANGTSPLSFSWFKNGNPLAPDIDATSPTGNGNEYTSVLTISDPTESDDGKYVVEVEGTDSDFSCPMATTKSFRLSVNQPPGAPTVASSSIEYCIGTTAVPLEATAVVDAELRWYDKDLNFLSEDSPTPPTTTVGSIKYYVSQKLGECETLVDDWVLITVTINDLPSVTITSPLDPTICKGSPITIEASGATSYVLDPNPGNASWTIAGTTGNITISPTATTTYTVTGTDDNGCSNVATITVIVDEISVAGAITGTITVCSGINNGNINLTSRTGDVIRWESSLDENFDTIATISEITDVIQFNDLTQSTYFRAVVQNGVCNEVFSDSALITVDEISVAGNINGVDGVGETDEIDEICVGTNSGSLDLTDYLGNIVEWQSSTNGDIASPTWTPVSPGNTSPTLIYSNLTKTTWYRVKVKSGECSEDYSENFKIQVDALPVGGELTFGGSYGSTYALCDNAISGLLNPAITLFNHFGTIKDWQMSSNAGVTWTPVSSTAPHTANTYNGYSNITSTTLFRAVIENGTCGIAYSKVAVINIIPSNIKPAPVSASPKVLCIGESVTLSSQTGYGSSTLINDKGDFNNANSMTNNGWRVRHYPHSGNDLNFPANGDDLRPRQWSNTNDHPFYVNNVQTGIAGVERIDSKEKKFGIVSGANPSTMETPVFNTLGLDDFILNYFQAYNLVTANDKIQVQISTDGGDTYPTIIQEVTGIANSDALDRFGVSTDPRNKISIDLSNYVGQSNLRIRFLYLGDTDGSIWAIDGISLPSKPLYITLEWRDNTATDPGELIGTTETVSWTPKYIGENIFEVTTFIIKDDAGNMCTTEGNSESVKVFVFDQYTSKVTTAGGTCGAIEVQLEGIIEGVGIIEGESQGIITSFPTLDGYVASWDIIGPSGYNFSPSHLIGQDENIDAINDPNAIFKPGLSGSYTITWKMTPTAKDINGNLIINNGCPPDPTPITIDIEDCTTLDFDGLDDYVDLGTTYSGTYSLEAWILPESSTGTIISGPNFEIKMEDLPALSPGTRWYHIAVSSGKLYIDGIDSGPSGTGTGGDNTLIGARWNNTSGEPENYFSGWIEEVRIWNTDISQDQIQFMMNQHLQNAGNMGVEIPMPVPGTLVYGDLAGYYRLISKVPDPLNLVTFPAALKPLNGFTPDLANTAVPGRLVNMTTNQENTAPLPYISAIDGQLWATNNTWIRPDVWDAPNSNGLGAPIDWNIVRINHDINSGDRDITVLGLKSETAGKLLNVTRSGTQNEYNPGQMLRVTHYLLLHGNIDLVGESQLLQDSGSILDDASVGYLERDQQGKRNSFVYNYWSSPVSPKGAGKNNAPYSVKSVLMDGTIPATPTTINFLPAYWAADGARATPSITISTYWLWGYSPAEANIYAEWDHILENGPLKTGEGFTMKGTDGEASIDARQNYTFRGKPHNGNFDLSMAADQNYLIGNPYPSAMDADKFILNNLSIAVGGNNVDDINVFDGSLYFWNHFEEVDHILKEYIGGYATYNLIAGIPAISNDERVNANDAKGTKYPGQYIPVAQAFLINSSGVNDAVPVSGGNIHFKNSQRIFKREKPDDDSQFLKPEVNTKTNKEKTQEKSKIRISFKSPVGYHRQILVGAIPSTTNGFDLGYDALLFDDNVEDMYWLQGDNQLVIQGVPSFDKNQVLPIGVKIKENKEFRIRIDTLENTPAEMKVYLNDKLKDSIHDLKAGAYVSTSEPGYIHDRFEIIFFKEEPPIVEGPIVGEPEVEGPIIEVPETDFTTLSIKHAHDLREIQIMNPDKLIITSVYLFDLNGNLIENYTNIPQNKEINLMVGNYSSGVYLLKVYAEGKIISKKIIISN